MGFECCQTHMCDNDGPYSKVKAGCGCTVSVCQECLDDLPAISHTSCKKCKGGEWSLESEQQDFHYWQDQSYSSYDDTYEDEYYWAARRYEAEKHLNYDYDEGDMYDISYDDI